MNPPELWPEPWNQLAATTPRMAPGRIDHPSNTWYEVDLLVLRTLGEEATR